MRRFLAIVALAALALAVAADQRVRLIARLATGQSFRYQVETHRTTSGMTTTPILNPEGGSRSSQSISLLVRLDVLRADATTKDGPAAAVHLRATYEKSQAKSQADAYDPSAPSLDDPYNRLEGHSIEFTIQPGGTVTDIKGLEDVFPSRSETDPILSWAKPLSTGPGTPGKGIAIGQKWSSQRSVTGIPLSDVVWRSESTYLRNEPCNASAVNAGFPLPSALESCAIVLTQFQMSRHGAPRSDATPPDYLHNGLRTSGTWEGSGESLDSISLVSGLVVRATQSSTQDVNYEITSASSGSTIHQVGHSTTHSEIKLLPASESAAQP